MKVPVVPTDIFKAGGEGVNRFLTVEAMLSTKSLTTDCPQEALYEGGGPDVAVLDACWYPDVGCGSVVYPTVVC